RSDPVALRLAALVAPDEARVEHGRRLVEHYNTVHLAGKTSRRDIRAAETGKLKHRAHGADRGFPPVFRILLCPAGFAHLHGLMVTRRRTHDVSVRAHDHDSRAGSSDINSHQV